ncbi:MAG: PAS domain S-box protein [Gammaproteobacteria bacterium]
MRKLLRRIPLSLFAAFLGLAAGLGLWEIIDVTQKDAVRELYELQLQENLEQRARETLIHFDHSLNSYNTAAQLLASHRRLANYLNPLYWFPDDRDPVIIYKEQPPPWLPEPSRWRPLISPSHILLIDSQGSLRELYQAGDIELPHELIAQLKDYLATDGSRVNLVTFDNTPWLLASTVAEDAAYNIMGTLMLVVPIDQTFLNSAQPGLGSERLFTALLDAEGQHILASSRPEVIELGEMSERLKARFAVTSQIIEKNIDSGITMLFATFIPRSSLDRFRITIVRLDQRQRSIMALSFIAFFSLLFMIVSNRLSKALRRLSKFSQRALGISQPVNESGNQLLILEDWMKQFINLVKQARDETRARHETEIQEKEAVTAAIMDASLDSIVTVDGEGNILHFNPTAERTFGYSEESAVGRSVGNFLFDAESRDFFETILRDCSLGREAVRDARTEMIAINRDGHRFPVEVAIIPITIEGHNLYTIYLHDISERRRQEYEIRSLAAFPAESPEPVMRVNRDGVLTYANDASNPLLDYFGIIRMQVIPLNWRHRIEQVLDKGENLEIEFDVGEQIFSIMLAPVRELDYVNLYARDITETRAAEAEARRHQTELVHVCRLSSMGEMATGMAHELNQPLAAIINYANGAKRRFLHGASAEELSEPLEQITSQAGRAARIIKRLREMVERQMPDRSSVNLNNMVHEVLSFMDFEIRKSSVEVQLDLVRELPDIRVDLVQMEQVVLNLVRNAVDALSEAGRKPAIIRISTGEQQEMLTLTVEDNGPGVPEETAAHLFEPFFSTKQTGMGMGLSISETIVADHDGRITYAPSKLGGAAFTIWLPKEMSKQDRLAS